MAFFAPSQSTSAAARLLASGADFVAPVVLGLEVRNVLLKAERRGLISPLDALAAIEAMEIIVRLRPLPAVQEPIYVLARAERLSYFDACYLDLALRENAALASRDGPLLAAALRQGVTVEDLR